MRKRWGVVVLAGAILVALLGTTPQSAQGGFSITYPKGPDPTVREWPSWPDPVSCGGLSFDPVAAFGGETVAETGSGGPELALRKFLDKAESPIIPTRFWRLAAATETQAEFAEGRLDQGPAWLSFQLSGGEWKLAGTLGYCVPRTVRAGSEGARWAIDGSQTLGPDTRRIKVDLSDSGGCDGGRSLNAAAEKPIFRQFGTRLVMTIWIEPLPPGIYTCQKLLEPPLVVKLPGRLGDRRLFDGRTYPPRLRQ